MTTQTPSQHPASLMRPALGPLSGRLKRTQKMSNDRTSRIWIGIALSPNCGSEPSAGTQCALHPRIRTVDCPDPYAGNIENILSFTWRDPDFVLGPIGRSSSDCSRPHARYDTEDPLSSILTAVANAETLLTITLHFCPASAFSRVRSPRP